MKTQKVRPIKSYNEKYLTYKGISERWRKENPERFRELTYRGMNSFKERNPDILKARGELYGVKYGLKKYIKGGVVADSTEKLVLERTGLPLPALVSHLGTENVKRWALFPKQYVFDHVIPMIRLKKTGLVQKSNYYTNLQIIPRDVNASWGDEVKGKVSEERIEEIVRSMVN